MDLSRKALAANFSAMSDEQLLTRFSSGTLTELAEDVMRQTLLARGIEPPTPPVANEPVDESTESTDLVLAAKFMTATEAFVVRGLLESEGVPAIVADANIVQTNELLAIAVGGVRVLVPERGLDRAREIIAGFRRGDYGLDA